VPPEELSRCDSSVELDASRTSPVTLRTEVAEAPRSPRRSVPLNGVPTEPTEPIVPMPPKVTGSPPATDDTATPPRLAPSRTSDAPSVSEIAPV